jgi:hypothetical protein
MMAERLNTHCSIVPCLLEKMGREDRAAHETQKNINPDARAGSGFLDWQAVIPKIAVGRFALRRAEQTSTDSSTI